MTSLTLTSSARYVVCVLLLQVFNKFKIVSSLIRNEMKSSKISVMIIIIDKLIDFKKEKVIKVKVVKLFYGRKKELMMDDYYPAADPIPDPEFETRYTTLMDFLSTSSEMRQTASSSLKQAMWSGSATLAGGLMMGPVGGLVGGIDP